MKNKHSYYPKDKNFSPLYEACKNIVGTRYVDKILATHLFIKNNIAYSTNIAIALKFPFDEENGAYKIVRCTKKEIVIEKTEYIFENYFKKNMLRAFGIDHDFDFSYTSNIRFVPEFAVTSNILLNYKYTLIAEELKLKIVNYTNNRKPVNFIGEVDNIELIIMPLRGDY